MSELIYGRRAVLETLRAQRRRVFRLWIEERPSKPAKRTQKPSNPKSATPKSSSLNSPNQSGGIVGQIQEEAVKHNIPMRELEGGLFERLAEQNVNAQGVALEVDEYPYVSVDHCLAFASEQQEDPLLLILDHLQDPQNLGTLIRSAEAMGVHGLIIPERRSARVTAAVSNASSGAVEHLRIAQVSNINRVINGLKKANVWVAGLDGASDTPLLQQANLAGGLAIVVGNEGSGLSRMTREKCDFLVRLPMLGQVESLNAAVAGSIVLYAARQARQ